MSICKVPDQKSWIADTTLSGRKSDLFDHMVIARAWYAAFLVGSYEEMTSLFVFSD